MNSKKIIYLHGFNSTGDTGTAAYRRELYADAFVGPHYEYIAPDKTAEVLDEVIDPAYWQYIMKEYVVGVFPEQDHYLNDYETKASAIKKAI